MLRIVSEKEMDVLFTKSIYLNSTRVWQLDNEKLLTISLEKMSEVTAMDRRAAITNNFPLLAAIQ